MKTSVDILANDFTEILPTLSQNQELLQAVNSLITTEPILAKATEGGNRLEKFREILKDLVGNRISLNEAYERTEVELPRYTSIHCHSNRVFASGWAERLTRTELSRFYNQAVMEKLMAEGEVECFVPHSNAEDVNSPCSLHLAGSNQDLKSLYNLLVNSYAHGNWSRQVKIPNHPHCTHVVTRSK